VNQNSKVGVTTMTSNKPYPGTQAVVRAISLLKVFSDEHDEWQLTDLAKEVGINKTTAFRLLKALEGEGLLARDSESNAYRLGFEMVTLGGLALRSNDIRSVTHPILESLAATTRETASLEVLIDSETLILDEVLGTHLMSGAKSIGTRWPAYATSTGKAMLATFPLDEINRRLPQRLEPLTEFTISSRELLIKELNQTQVRGYAVAWEELELGLVAIGAPLRNYDGGTVGAISLAGPTRRLTRERLPGIGGLICEKAREISRRLGYPAL
jgi:DNA-binding IclR family transcriptional regulator